MEIKREPHWRDDEADLFLEKKNGKMVLKLAGSHCYYNEKDGEHLTCTIDAEAAEKIILELRSMYPHQKDPEYLVLPDACRPESRVIVRKGSGDDDHIIINSKEIPSDGSYEEQFTSLIVSGKKLLEWLSKAL